MTNLRVYLAFDNALEAMHYYEKQYGAKILKHETVDEELMDVLNISQDDLNTSTFFGEFSIYDNILYCSDRFDSKDDFSNNLNLMLEFEDLDLFNEMYNLSKEDKQATFIFENLEDDVFMFRFIDAYGLVWSVVYLDEEEF